jgi:hypothetical protein
MLTRDAIQAAEDRTIEKIEMVVDWNDSICVRTPTGKQRDLFETAVQNAQRGRFDLRGLKVRLVILCACDEEGNALFQATDAEWLNEKSARAIDQIFQVAQRLAGLSAEDVEELVGNSSGDLSADSGSD